MQIEVARKITTLTFLLLAGIGIAAAQQTPPSGAPAPPPPPPMILTSTAFRDGAVIPSKYTCAADPNAVSPPLQWSDVPKGTASFVLVFHDIESFPNKSSLLDVLHWMAWNLPADAQELPEGVPPDPELPNGSRQGNNRRGKTGYMGPCAPPGIPHHYVFELFAVDRKVDLAPVATRDDVLKGINGHVLGHAVLVGLFHR